MAAATSLGLWLGSQPARAPAAASYQSFSHYPQPRALSAFSLDGSDGQPVDAARLRGRHQLVFFGFTHCPDVCPTALAVMRDIEKQLPAAKLEARVGFVFISVDPERDTLKVLGDYTGYFSKNILAATADHPRLAALTRELGVLYVREATDSPDYSVDHSAALFVLDPEGRLIGRFSPPLEVVRIVADLKLLAGP